MLRRCITAEWIKLRHSRMWMILIILPFISVLIGCFNFYMNQGVLNKEWYSLWSQVSLFYGEFFFPILIAIFCAYMWRLEHFNKNWNMIMTAPISATSIFFSKFIVVGVLLILVQGLFFLFYFLGGKLLGLNSELPVELLGWILRGWISALTISTLQLALSMRIPKFCRSYWYRILCIDSWLRYVRHRFGNAFSSFTSDYWNGSAQPIKYFIPRKSSSVLHNERVIHRCNQSISHL